MGATAIEDKLQDGVPDAIANLAEVSQREGHTQILIETSISNTVNRAVLETHDLSLARQ